MLSVLSNFTEPTRIKINKDGHLSSTLIDVIIRNNDSVQDNLIVGCSFSDYKFVLDALDLIDAKPIDLFAIARCLNEKSPQEFNRLVENTDFSAVEKFSGVNKK